MTMQRMFHLDKKLGVVRYTTLVHPEPGDDLLVSRKISRNAPCPCRSGKKAKYCCGNETKYYSAKAAK